MDVTEGFIELFRGQRFAYGLSHGECIRQEVTDEVWRGHLEGDRPIGIYPTVKLSTGTIDGASVAAKWGCSDVDTHGPRGFDTADARVHAKNLVTALGVLGHRGWPELTKSGGWHVWLFLDGWADARTVRNTLLLAHQLADVPAYEVNPKDALGATELGSYVNLPYPAHAERRVVFDGDERLSVSDFVTRALSLRSPVAQLHETAGLYVPPPPPAPVTMRAFSGRTEGGSGAGTPGASHSKDITDEELRHAVEQLNGKGFVIWRDGPNQGGRALTMFRLGVECRESGLTPDEAMTVLVDWDWRYGKFLSGVDGHTNGIRYIEDAVRKIYG